MSFAHKLKLARNSLGKSQQQMAELLGISKRGWQTYENGSSIPGGRVLRQLAELGFNINWFFTYNVPMMISSYSNYHSISQPPPDKKKEPSQLLTEAAAITEGITILGRIYSSGDQELINAINTSLQAFNKTLEEKETFKK